MVHVLGGALSAGASGISASLSNILPASFALVSKKNVGTIVPSEPASHTIGKEEDLVLGLLMDPVSHGTLQIGGNSGDLVAESFLQAGEDIVEWQCVGREVDPAAVSSEESQSLTWPQAVGLVPDGDVGTVLRHVFNKGVHIALPGERG